MGNNNRQNQELGTLATLALGAGAIAYGAYKFAQFLSGSNERNEPIRANWGSASRSPPVRALVPNRNVIVVSKMEECRQAIQTLKSYAISNLFYISL